MVMPSKEKALYVALKRKYKAEILENRAILLIYFSDSVGIGEHSTHLVDMDKLVSNIANAEDKLKSLKKHFSYVENGDVPSWE